MELYGQERAEKAKQEGVCMVCLKTPPKGRLIRHTCGSCYNVLRREVQKGFITDDKAVECGLWAPRHPGGRPQALARHIIREAVRCSD